MQTRSFTRLGLLLVVGLIALLPLGQGDQLFPGLGRVVDMLPNTVLAHAIGHMTIFCLVGLALLAAFPALRQQPLRYLAIILVLGILQEGFQLALKQRPIVFDEFRDLVTDLAGGMVGYSLRWLMDKRAVPRA